MRFSLFVLFTLLLSSCASTPKNTPEQWRAYVNFKKKFYNYSSLPVKSFTCDFESPALTDSLQRIQSKLEGTDKYKATVRTKGVLTFEREKNDFFVKAPGLHAEKSGFWSKIWSGPQDSATASMNMTTYQESSAYLATVLSLAYRMRIPEQKGIYVREVSSDANGHRAIIEVGESSAASQLKGLLLTESLEYKNGFKINSKYEYKKAKNGLLPLNSSVFLNDGLATVDSKTDYEFQNVSGWQLPKKISSVSRANRGGTEVVSNIVINFTNCSVVK